MRAVWAASERGTEGLHQSVCCWIDLAERACGRKRGWLLFFGPSVNPTSSLERRGTSREL